MQQPMVHLYTGEGKGKTTAAMGLALRALGNEKKVIIVQFLKGMPTGEVVLLEKMGATVLREDSIQKFVFQMNPQEKQAAKQAYNALLQQALEFSCDVLILDEICAACTLNMIDENFLKVKLEQCKHHTEIVMTGRDPQPWMIDWADYYTEMVNHKHPYEKGISARKGIEF